MSLASLVTTASLSGPLRRYNIVRNAQGGASPARLVTSVWATLLVAGLAAWAGTATARQAWPDDFTARLEALALIETLRAQLLSQDSATVTLDRWCAQHDLAPPSQRIVAERDPTVHKEATPAELGDLAVAGPDELRYRRVKLGCGGHVVSEADNWYVPARLTDAMNDTLEHTDTSFGRVVATLHFRRRTLSSVLLWHPLPQNWEMGTAPSPGTPDGHGPAILAIPHAIFENRAILTLPDGRPFSEVVETYTSGILDFPPPPSPPPPAPPPPPR